MRIIDFRFRPHTADTVAGITADNPIYGSLFTLFGLCGRRKAEPLDAIATNLRAKGVVKAVVTGRDVESTYGTPSGNAWVLECMAAAPDLFVGYVGLDPRKGMHAIAELREMTRRGMRGVSLDPYLTKLPADHALYYPIYAICCELGLPVIITSGPALRIPGAVMDDAHPRRIDRVATDFPDLRIIFSHGGYPFLTETLITAQRHEHVYIEFSECEHVPGAEAYVEAANTYLADKMLFASAHPFNDIYEHIDVYNKLDFTPESREKVMYGNAARLLGLE